MTMPARQPADPPAPVVLCAVHRCDLVCPRCSAPALVAELPPARLALTIDEACAALGISDTTLRLWERERGLPVVRIGQTVRVPTAALEAWLAREAGG